MQPLAEGATQAAVILPDAPLPVSQPFELTVWLCGGEMPEGLSVDAMMPAHQHGTNYTPKVTAKPDGLFDVSGMVFHMPGQWRIDVAARDGADIRRFELDVTAR